MKEQSEPSETADAGDACGFDTNDTIDTNNDTIDNNDTNDQSDVNSGGNLSEEAQANSDRSGPSHEPAREPDQPHRGSATPPPSCAAPPIDAQRQSHDQAQTQNQDPESSAAIGPQSPLSEASSIASTASTARRRQNRGDFADAGIQTQGVLASASASFAARRLQPASVSNQWQPLCRCGGVARSGKFLLNSHHYNPYGPWPRLPPPPNSFRRCPTTASIAASTLAPMPSPPASPTLSSSSSGSSSASSSSVSRMSSIESSRSPLGLLQGTGTNRSPTRQQSQHQHQQQEQQREQRQSIAATIASHPSLVPLSAISPISTAGAPSSSLDQSTTIFVNGAFLDSASIAEQLRASIQHNDRTVITLRNVTIDHWVVRALQDLFHARRLYATEANAKTNVNALRVADASPSPGTEKRNGTSQDTVNAANAASAADADCMPPAWIKLHLTHCMEMLTDVFEAIHRSRSVSELIFTGSLPIAHNPRYSLTTDSLRALSLALQPITSSDENDGKTTQKDNASATKAESTNVADGAHDEEKEDSKPKAKPTREENAGSSLKTLCLRGTRIPREGLMYLCRDGLGNPDCPLVTLRLSQVHFQATDVVLLADALASNRRLEVLLLSHCKLSSSARTSRPIASRSIGNNAARHVRTTLVPIGGLRPPDTAPSSSASRAMVRDAPTSPVAASISPANQRFDHSGAASSDGPRNPRQQSSVDSRIHQQASSSQPPADHRDGAGAEDGTTNRRGVDASHNVENDDDDESIESIESQPLVQPNEHDDEATAMALVLEALEHHPALQCLLIYGMRIVSPTSSTGRGAKLSKGENDTATNDGPPPTVGADGSPGNQGERQRGHRAVQALRRFLEAPTCQLWHLGLKHNIDHHHNSSGRPGNGNRRRRGQEQRGNPHGIARHRQQQQRHGQQQQQHNAALVQPRNPNIEQDRSLGIHPIIEALRTNRTVKYLQCSGNGITSNELEQLSAVLVQSGSTSPPTLAGLNLTDNAIDDDGLRALASRLHKVKCLRFLDLQANPFTDDGKEALIGALKNNWELERLDLDGTPHEMKAYYMALNRGGRRLLLQASGGGVAASVARKPNSDGASSSSEHSLTTEPRVPAVPLGLWPVVLARVNRLQFGRSGHNSHLDVLNCLIRGPALFERPQSLAAHAPAGNGSVPQPPPAAAAVPDGRAPLGGRKQAPETGNSSNSATAAANPDRDRRTASLKREAAVDFAPASKRARIHHPSKNGSSI